MNYAEGIDANLASLSDWDVREETTTRIVPADALDPAANGALATTLMTYLWSHATRHPIDNGELYAFDIVARNGIGRGGVGTHDDGTDESLVAPTFVQQQYATTKWKFPTTSSPSRRDPRKWLLVPVAGREGSLQTKSLSPPALSKTDSIVFVCTNVEYGATRSTDVAPDAFRGSDVSIGHVLGWNTTNGKLVFDFINPQYEPFVSGYDERCPTVDAFSGIAYAVSRTVNPNNTHIFLLGASTTSSYQQRMHRLQSSISNNYQSPQLIERLQQNGVYDFQNNDTWWHEVDPTTGETDLLFNFRTSHSFQVHKPWLSDMKRIRTQNGRSIFWNSTEHTRLVPYAPPLRSSMVLHATRTYVNRNAYAYPGQTLENPQNNQNETVGFAVSSDGFLYAWLGSSLSAEDGTGVNGTRVLHFRSDQCDLTERVVLESIQKAIGYMTWTMTIASASWTAGVGTTVTQTGSTSSVGTLSVELTGAATTTITIRSAVGQVFNTNADLVIGGSGAVTVAENNLVSAASITTPTTKNVMAERCGCPGLSVGNGSRYYRYSQSPVLHEWPTGEFTLFVVAIDDGGLRADIEGNPANDVRRQDLRPTRSLMSAIDVTGLLNSGTSIYDHVYYPESCLNEVSASVTAEREESRTRVIWSINASATLEGGLGNMIHMSPVGAHDLVYVPTRLSLSAIEVSGATRGTVRWDKMFSARIVDVYVAPGGPRNLDPRQVYVRTLDRIVTAINHENGDIAWSYQAGEQTFSHPIRGSDHQSSKNNNMHPENSYYVQSSDGTTHSLDCPNDGHIVLDRLVYVCPELTLVRPTSKDLCMELESPCFDEDDAVSTLRPPTYWPGRPQTDFSPQKWNAETSGVYMFDHVVPI